MRINNSHKSKRHTKNVVSQFKCALHIHKLCTQTKWPILLLYKWGYPDSLPGYLDGLPGYLNGLLGYFDSLPGYLDCLPGNFDSLPGYVDSLPVTINTRGWREALWQESVLPRTLQTTLPGLEPRLLDPEPGAFTVGAQCLPLGSLKKHTCNYEDETVHKRRRAYVVNFR